MARVLIIDDEDNIRVALKSALEKRGHEIVTAATRREGAEFSRAAFDVIFLDVLLPDGNGIDLLQDILLRNPKQLVVMISGHADIETAVKATRLGAYDFLEKPLSLDRILVTVENATKAGRLLSERDRLARRVYGEFIGESSAVRQIKQEIQRSAPKAGRFLILGENGTGKELVAHLIHQQGKHAAGPFVAVNCAALPKELVESELFGHTQGAFTGATHARKGRFLEAHGGTIFLDEIGDMPLEAQAKILRVIENAELSSVGSDKTVPVDCVIIAASNRNLEQLVNEQRFRQDLYYRLNVITIHLPPLRERRDDIVLLADYFLARFATESASEKKTLSADAVAYLQQLALPGNVRELKNLMERANIYCDTSLVTAKELRALAPSHATSSFNTTLKEAVDRFEEEFIRGALARNDGNMAETARQLGVERSHLYKKLKKFEGEG
jgi:two-component system nitrogen regulation response regulator NtrX